jgi:predicted RNase H-like HicB family nuclease
MQTYTAVIEKCKETGLFVGFVPGLTGAHSQGETLEELRLNLIEVIELISDEGNLEFESEFIGIEEITLN